MNLTKSDFYDKLDKLSGYALVNFLWVVMSLPLITIPAATAGLFAATIDGIRGKETSAFTRFFAGLRQYWWKSSLIALIDLGVTALVVVNVLITTRADMPAVAATLALGMTIGVAVLAAAANLYIWTLLVVFDLPLRELVTLSIKLVILHPLWSLIMLGLTGLALLIGVTAPAIIFLFALFATCVWLVNWGAWRVIRQYENDLGN